MSIFILRHKLTQLVRFSGFTLLFFLFFGAFYIWQVVQFVFHVLRLADMYRFYTHLLGIPDVGASMFIRVETLM